MPLLNHQMLGIDFVSGPLEEVRHEIFDFIRRKKCAVIVTPNVDHIIRIHESRDLSIREAYLGADIRLCDSRVLALIGRWIFNEDILACPGSDLVTSLVSNPGPLAGNILVFGPSFSDFAKLTNKFPYIKFVYVEAPHNLRMGSSDWELALTAVESTEWDLAFVCISFPKQELFATELKRRARATGVVLCVGASVDFLTARQARAPSWIQHLSLEWCYRLMSNPRRLGKRYIFSIPKIIRLIYVHRRA
ncbi:WecB/TagA/CpsF family glycosyltransferase [Rhizobium rhododendri]|uniref:WecB/TagA/CpsF family glycosyltransferase n=1 Tax=Rhizobium rhododendri TaxID=2506430 RepID=A0ABY8IPX4_9HYPH|nr:WecB/TagA/CpsF family glycosyltransferase [Rhizobium rhododendri]WFS25218.1 WecB/TagA/CpsF family glycosyltransferase [Rhizobium rhododendri]